jgi:Protein of unknown function (DUF3987)
MSIIPKSAESGCGMWAQGKVRANGHSALPPIENVGDTGAHWLSKALDKVNAGAACNPTGQWLACQLRDAGMAYRDAELWMELYTGRVPDRDHAYTLREALATLRSAYGRPPREPAKTSGLVNGKSYAKNAQNAPSDSEGQSEESEGENNAHNAYDEKPFPVADPAMYYGPAGDIVNALADETEASPVALMTHFLVSVGNAAGRTCRFLVEDTPHHANLFAVLVGLTSGGRKGTACDRIERVFILAGGQAAHWFDINAQRGLSSGEGLISALRDAAPDEANAEGNELLRDKCLLVCEDEFASMLKVASREGSILSPVLREAWDGKRLQTLTKNAPMRASNAHLSIVGHITASELLKYLTSSDANNGLANRFLWVATKRANVLPFGGDLDKVCAALKKPLPKLNAALV